MNLLPPILRTEDYKRHLTRLLSSFRRWTGRDLLTPSSDLAHDVFESPIVIVSHGTQEDPILNFGNRRALDLWEMTWDQLIQTPSRLTAEAQNRDERARLLKDVTEKGYSSDYQGIRISSTGRRFRIEEAIVWNIVDENEVATGQAATFSQWTYL